MISLKRYRPILAWLLAGIAILGGTMAVMEEIVTGPPLRTPEILALVMFEFLLPVLYSCLGALILSRQPANTVGWLMLLSAQNPTNLFIPFVGGIDGAPEVLTPAIWFFIWVGDWSWILFIFPIFLIPLYFPNGRLPSPRWAWVARLALLLGSFLTLTTAFTERIGAEGETWTIENPIGFIPSSLFGDWFFFFWGIGLMTVVGGSVAALFVRYRRAGFTEREQIKWLLLAGVIFFVAYGITYALTDPAVDEDWSAPFFLVSLLIFPIAIAIAILRHRLYDIDLVIRRTLQYSLLTGILAALYFGGVVLLQRIVSPLTGDPDSPLVTVVTTLGIAALFNPVRRTTQYWIDRRFFRAKYDAEQELAGFSRAARDEVDLDLLAESLLAVVARTIQPSRTSLWLRENGGR